MSLTTRERDILRIILNAQRPMGSAELAGMLHITPRQVNYSLQGVRVWLRQHNQDLKAAPGVGYAVELPPDQAQALFKAISIHAGVQIVLSVSQRQQLLALFLLMQAEPVILSQLEQLAQVSRMTLAKDLDEIALWLTTRQVNVVRKPHFGIQVNGSERACQRALAELVWGETTFSDDPIIEITHHDGLTFSLQGDARLSPLIEHAGKAFAQINMRRTIRLIAKAEEQLGGRFTDDAVLHLALVTAILAQRIQDHRHLELDADRLRWLQTTQSWNTAAYVAQRLSRETNLIWKTADVAGVAMEMLAAPRNEILPGELERNNAFSVPIEQIMEYVSQAMGISKVRDDRTLQNGLLNNIVPACFRQRFDLWLPRALNNASLPEQYEHESGIALGVADLVNERTGIRLPTNEINNLVALLRAAYIRNRTYRFERIYVVCPSGMATSQLLVARLNARFPHLTVLEVISLRDLTPALVAAADLVLTTVPLARQFAQRDNVIQVHPALMPEDIEAITRFLS